MKTTIALMLALLAGPAGAQVVPPPGMDVYVLGEVHDNPSHHAEQARLLALVAPKTVVWEMLTPEQVVAMEGVDRADLAAMEKALDWAHSGWPDFALYHPIFAAAGGAAHLGATVPRADLRKAIGEGAGAALGERAEGWPMGPLATPEQEAREAEQREAHCNALPEDLLPGMVEAQRMRDWSLASLAVAAVEAGQGPVVVITGTGHARKDWGAPALIAAARPGVKVWSLGQIEGAPDGNEPFDAVQTAPAPEREDPCRAFSAEGGNG